MARLPAMARGAVVVALLAVCCCLIHAPAPTSAAAAAANADASFPPGEAKVMLQDTRVAPPSSCSAGDDQAVLLAGEAETAESGGGRVDLELQDYPGSGANDRHSPWGQERRN